jgi:hypothetical protein
MVTPTSSSQSEVRDDTREQEGTKPQISNQQQMTASSSVAPSAPALPQGSPERPTTGPITHAPPTLVEPTLSASERLSAAHEAQRRALAEDKVRRWQNLPQPNAPQHPVYRRKKDFLKKGIVMLPMNDPQIDAGQVCPFCLNRYTNDPAYLADLCPLADLHGRVPTNAAGGDDVAYQVLRCNHIFHLDCLKAMKDRKCMSCNEHLFHRSAGRWLKDVGKKSCYDGGEWD